MALNLNSFSYISVMSVILSYVTGDLGGLRIGQGEELFYDTLYLLCFIHQF